MAFRDVYSEFYNDIDAHLQKVVNNFSFGF